VFYVLTLKTSAITLVYDDKMKKWHRWTTYTVGEEVEIEVTTDEYGITTATTTSPNSLEDGDPISVTYNNGVLDITETVNVTFVSTVQFTFTASQTVVDGSANYIPWISSYFPFVFYTRGANEDLLLAEQGSDVMLFEDAVYQDSGQPINTLARTSIEDWGVMREKRFNRLELVGDLEPTTVLVRYNDHDYKAAKWSTYRSIVVEADRAQIAALGSGRRRAHEFRHTDNTSLRMIALEADFDVGAR
jgi:hypothetical protein